METLIRVAKVASRAPVALACLALFVLMGMTFADVIGRSAFDAPIEAATELTRILMAVMVFSCLPVISARGGHIAVDLFDGFFDRWHLNRLREAAIHIACGVMLAWPAQRVWVLAGRARDYGDVTEYLSIPVFYVTAFIAVSVAVTAAVMVAVGLVHLVAPYLLDEDIAA
ncbi:TRAP transporter small permease [Rhodovulum adriaticum]|uniref:TRAP transporter small permease protein n=1 Tax=Rhodovulum adriaticum TaxID=35804 RepID=A0A4R2NY67_RHOAD|nr:TRAP transporter small permease subunit [Rhodovulum adriaticum]MBK1636426.1 C4-dicarboxylate ABC transporter permease [Rhodovulum adriaticum]TCP26481.1 TRAP-type C4-dicarboxylate transport system permease small subunit [Rhodovulum adriaticum]